MRSRGHTLLFLVAIVLGDASLEQLARLVVFGDDDNLGFLLLRSQVSMGAQQHGGGPRRTLRTTPRQKPVPLSNQSLFLSS